MPKFVFVRCLMLCGLLAVSAQAWAQSALTLNITGIKGELKDNVAIYLQKFTEDEVSAGTRLHAALTQEAEKALQALGYYQSEIEVHPKPDNPLALTLHIKAGKPVLIDTVDIQLSGDAANDADFAALLQQQAPKRGAILHHGQYEGLKSALRNLALRKGYFDARFSLNRLEVAPELNQAFVRLHFDSGVRYRFGEVTFSGQQIDSARLQSLLPFAAGDAYLASQLGELNQALATTGWFSSILVEGNTEQISDFHLPVEVSLAPERRNIIETGIGYSTDVGARLKLNWLKPWLNSAGHSLRTDLALSEIEQSIEAAYKLPLQHSATDYYQLQLGVRNRDTEDTASRESNLVLERYWLLGNQWYRTASLRWLYEDFVQADQRDNISLIMPGISYNRSRQAGGAMPHSADRLALRVEVSDEAWGSGASFVRLRGRAGWIGSAGDNHRFVTRLDAGAILMEALRKLPPSLRFFAGGDNSIRGFGYETISPTNEQGELIGGRYLLTGSAEYQYRLRGNWWLAAFTDYGSAWDDNPDWQQGVGVGVRWASPVGPIRLDFAFGLDQPGSGFQLHFALGPEL
ncbi:autotransporter assembly complex protein TamA [Rheinheimera nanhaiensis]|nr:autotransporter assembly complex family protein [Rheinheimera nanhaiensis]